MILTSYLMKKIKKYDLTRIHLIKSTYVLGVLLKKEIDDKRLELQKINMLLVNSKEDLVLLQKKFNLEVELEAMEAEYKIELRRMFFGIVMLILFGILSWKSLV